MDSGRWHAVEGDTSQGVVVVVDFAGARPDDSLMLLRPGPEAPAFVQPALPAAGCADAATHVGVWAAGLRLEGWSLHGVVARCGGATLATSLAAEVDGAPPVVLLDPYRIRPGAVMHEFRAALAQYEDLVGQDELDELVREVEGEATSVRATARAVDVAYRRLSAAALGGLGVDEDVVEDLCDRFTQYQNYLVACAETPFTTTGGSVAAFFSDDFGVPEGLDADVVHRGGDHDGLLEDTQVRNAVRGLTRMANRRSPHRR